MPDPFEALRTAPTPIDPEPAFAARLRARLARALAPSDQGDPRMTLQVSETENRLRQGDLSYLSLWVPDLERAAAFYAAVLGWKYHDSGPDRAALQVDGQSMSMGIGQLEAAAGFMRNFGVPLPPTETLAPTAYVVFVVDQLEAAIERVRAAGGFASGAMDQPYGRVAACMDDQGLAFTLHEAPGGIPAPRPPANGGRHGDVAYVSFAFPDGDRARRFYSSVLGVQFAPGRSPGGWNLPEAAPMSGFVGGESRASVVPMFRVDDIRAGVERVRAAGGTAGEPMHEGYGIRAECSDDQGVRFHLGQL
jgi:uncharacterized protein